MNSTKQKSRYLWKTKQTVKGNINIELRVQTEAASIGDDNQAFNYNPQTELPAGTKMILRWDIGIPSEIWHTAWKSSHLC